MTGSELVVVQAASSAIASVVNAANTVYSQIRSYGIEQDTQRELLRVQLEQIRSYEIAEGLLVLHRQQFRGLRELFDDAETRRGTPSYDVFFKAATEASRELADNIRDYLRAVR
ncbi:hypothetical protein RB608_20045 [Nocardioides sp. LHD-245]|uniref:hypothetical protein n=1 Tax=Nocardioides sp. LHD-245 TaxID=3051387 RepID=UPI0027E0C60A|nr:hypothetical protein [Nocardioides sp. LHD-245]